MGLWSNTCVLCNLPVLYLKLAFSYSHLMGFFRDFSNFFFFTRFLSYSLLMGFFRDFSNFFLYQISSRDVFSLIFVAWRFVSQVLGCAFFLTFGEFCSEISRILPDFFADTWRFVSYVYCILMAWTFTLCYKKSIF